MSVVDRHNKLSGLKGLKKCRVTTARSAMRWNSSGINIYRWYITTCTEVIQNFAAIASKYVYPDAFRYFLLSFDNFSYFNLSAQLINFYIICIALTDFCMRAWNSRWKWNVCKRASGFHKRAPSKTVPHNPFSLSLKLLLCGTHCKHRGEDSIERYFISNSNVDHAHQTPYH